MSKLLLPRDQNGGLSMIGGRVIKTQTWPFLHDTALPPEFLNTCAGSSTLTFSATDAGNTVGYVSLNSISAANAGFKYLAGCYQPSYETIRFDIEGVNFADANPNTLQLGLTNGTQGGYFLLGAAATSAALTGTGTNSTAINYDWTETNHRNLGVMLYSRYRQLYLFEDDQVLADVDFSSVMVTSGPVWPFLIYNAQASSNSTLNIQQIRLTTTSF